MAKQLQENSRGKRVAQIRGKKMKLLEEKILNCGELREGNILKVDSFLNHQVDTELLDKMAEDWISRIDADKITKILTIESSGIAIAHAVASKLKIPYVFAKKTESANIAGDVYSTKVISYTHFREYDVIVSKSFLNADDHVFIFDDFLANGCAMKGLLSLVKQSGATVEGIGIAIEKSFQPGGNEIRNAGYKIDSLARIKKMDCTTGKIEFE